jgi:hypothetical protein
MKPLSQPLISSIELQAKSSTIKLPLINSTKSSQTIPFFISLGAHVGIIFAPTTIENLNSDPKNAPSLAIAICTRDFRPCLFFIFSWLFQLKSKKQKQTMKSKTGFWNAEKQASEEMN